MLWDGSGRKDKQIPWRIGGKERDPMAFGAILLR